MIEDALTLVWNSIFVQSSLLYRATSCPYLSWRLLWRPQEQTKKVIKYKRLKIKLNLTCCRRLFQAFAGNQVNQTHLYFCCILLCLSKWFDVKKNKKKTKKKLTHSFPISTRELWCLMQSWRTWRWQLQSVLSNIILRVFWHVTVSASYYPTLSQVKAWD